MMHIAALLIFKVSMEVIYVSTELIISLKKSVPFFFSDLDSDLRND